MTVKISVHRVDLEEYEKLDFPEDHGVDARWKTLEVRTRDGGFAVVFFPDRRE